MWVWVGASTAVLQRFTGILHRKEIGLQVSSSTLGSHVHIPKMAGPVCVISCCLPT